MSDETPTLPLTDDTATPVMPAAVPTAPATDAAARLPRPRIRWGAIVWGLVMACIAAATLAVVTAPARLDAFATWQASLSPASFTLVVLLVIGALLLIAGLAGLLRRASRPRS